MDYVVQDQQVEMFFKEQVRKTHFVVRIEFAKSFIFADSNSNNAGSVLVQGVTVLDAAKSYGTVKPGIGCIGSSCGSPSFSSSATRPGGCASGKCGNADFNSHSSTAGAVAASGIQSGISTSGCPNGGCTSSGYNSGGTSSGFGYNLHKSGSFGGVKSASGSFSSASSIAGSGVDLGPLTHLFGAKSGATANAGSFSSSGSFAKSGSFASSK